MTNQATIGHNNPPTDAELFAERMQEKHGQLLDRINALLEDARNVPNEVTDDAGANQLADLVKNITKATKDADAVRVDEKEPYLSMGRVVDAFFKTRAADALGSAKTNVNRPLTAYLERKAAEERARLAEEARKAREKAEAEAKIAADLEAAKLKTASDAALEQAAMTEARAAKLELQAEAKPAALSKVSSGQSTAGLRTRWVGEVLSREDLNLEALRQHLPADALQKALNSFIAAGGRTLNGARIYEQTEAVVR